MLEIIAYFARWSQVTANLILFGSSFFLVIAGSRKVLSEAPWIPRVEKMFPWLALLVLLGLTGLLATTTGSATGDETNAWTPKAWLQFIHNTQVGVIAFIRILLAVLLFAVVIYTLLKPRSRRRYAFLTFTAALPLIAGAFMSHSSADEMSFAAIAPFVLHLLFAGMWFGALPVFLLILLTNHRETDIVESEWQGVISYSIEIQVWGEGDALILRDGQQYPARWLRPERTHMIQFVSPEGTPLALRPGVTWFQLLPPPGGEERLVIG